MSHMVHEEGHAHYLTFSCYRKLWLFKGEPFYSSFLDHLQRARERHDFHLYAYVIMPNHVHLLLYPYKTTHLPNILRTIKRLFAFHALKILREKYPELASKLIVSYGKRMVTRFWQQGGGYDRNIFGDKALRKTIEYIHNNPVRNGLVEYPEDWLWSSARFWLQGIKIPLEMNIPELWKETYARGLEIIE